MIVVATDQNVASASSLTVNPLATNLIRLQMQVEKPCLSLTHMRSDAEPSDNEPNVGASKIRVGYHTLNVTRILKVDWQLFRRLYMSRLSHEPDNRACAKDVPITSGF